MLLDGGPANSGFLTSQDCESTRVPLSPMARMRGTISQKGRDSPLRLARQAVGSPPQQQDNQPMLLLSFEGEADDLIEVGSTALATSRSLASIPSSAHREEAGEASGLS